MRTTALCLLLFVLAAPAFGGWEEDLDQILTLESGEERESLITSVAGAAPGWEALAERIRSRVFPAGEKGDAYLGKTLCTDEKERPWVLFVPESYDPAVPTPLLVVLHGGVSRPKVTEKPLEWAKRNLFVGLARERGWLVLFPFGQIGATWWDRVGMANVRNLVRTVKRERNVDDDRVYMAGFSDGASAGFLHAMVAPTDYAAFVALNGHMGVGSIDGGLPTYANNMMNSPIYAVTTLDDPLYPSARMRPTIKLARKAGARIFYRELDGGHDFAYAPTELPRIGAWLAGHARNPLPSRIDWESAGGEFGRCGWFKITRVKPGRATSWHKNENLVLIDDHVTIGFSMEPYEGDGVKVGTVAEGSYADLQGLKAGDLIVEVNGLPIVDSRDLSAVKESTERGAVMKVTVVRDGEKVFIEGTLPEPETYFLFKHEKPSARARVDFAANRVSVEGSRLGGFRILVHPDMFNLDQEIVVELNGRNVFQKKVEPDAAFLLRNFLKNRDRRLLYVAEIAIRP